MTTNTIPLTTPHPLTKTQLSPSAWTGIYRAGAVAALLVILTVLTDIAITFVPNTGFVPGERTALDWFAAYNSRPLLALRDMGILNIITSFSTVIIFFALYGAHRKTHAAPAALAVIILCMGATVYIANNMALPMLSLSQQYAAATSESHKAALVSVGQVLLAQEDVGAGAFLGFFIPEIAGVLMALVMLRGRIFSRWAGWAGLLCEGCLMIFNILAAFAPGLYSLAMGIAMLGGPLSLVWFAMMGVRLWGMEE